MTNSVKETKNAGVDAMSMVLVIAIIIISVVSVNCYIEKYEKDYKCNALNTELASVQNDYALLQIEYQKRTSYAVVENYVTTKLSMSKINPYQVEYLSRDTSETMHVVDNGEENTSFVDRVSKVFSVVLEYFK